MGCLMKYMKKLFFVWMLALPLGVFAQTKPQPPIPVELLIGHNRMNVTMSVNKPIIGNWRFNNITSVAADYKNTRSETELVVVNSLVYQLHPYFGASGGLQYHFLKGLVPNVAFHASYADPTWLLVLTPYMNMLPNRNLETVAIAEFKPQLSENLKLFTRAQALYNHDLTENFHDRSYYYFRLGLSVRKFTFGVAANLDYYGPNRAYKDNFGGFLEVGI